MNSFFCILSPKISSKYHHFLANLYLMKIHKVFNHRKFNCENHSTLKQRIFRTVVWTWQRGLRGLHPQLPTSNQIWSPDTGWDVAGAATSSPVLPPTPPCSFNQIGEREMPQITWGPPCQADGARGRGRDGAGDTLTYGVVSCDPV